LSRHPRRIEIAMGLFSIGCKIENHKDPRKSAVVPRILVDTGSEYTWIDGGVLERIGIEPVKKDLQIQMANGSIITRSVGFAIIRVGSALTTDEVVLAQ
jgi:predicted aspartyl protease